MLRKFWCIFKGWLIWWWGSHFRGKIGYLSPNNEGYGDTDEDSGDENELLPKDEPAPVLKKSITVWVI